MEGTVFWTSFYIFRFYFKLDIYWFKVIVCFLLVLDLYLALFQFLVILELQLKLF